MFNNYQKQLDFLKKSFEAGKLAHAYLFSGQDVEGINNFANEFTKFINCLTPGVKYCGDCQNCRMIEKGIFADLLVVRSADSKKSIENKKDMEEILKEQIRDVRGETRDVQSFLAGTSFYGGKKSVIIENAERMNWDAQDSLLKNLEEPKGGALIILISSKPDLLLPTIISRCQQIKFIESENLAEEKLPADLLKVINSDLAEKFQYAKKTNLDNGNFEKILIFLQQYFRNLLLKRVQNGNTDLGYSVKKLKKIIRFIDSLYFQNKTTNFNQRLALEVLFLEI